MFIVGACVAGGVAYAGVKTFINRRPRKKATWLTKWDPSGQGESASDASRLDATELNEALASQHLTIASVSLGLSVSGAWFYPPLSLVSVPLTIYGTIPSFERTYRALFKEMRLRMVVVHSAILIGLLATRYYVLAALLNWLQHYFTIVGHRLRTLNRLLRLELENGYRQFMSQAHGAKPGSVWVVSHGVGVEVPFEDLQTGDVVIMNEGELIPIEGTIVEGTAEVCQLTPARVGRLEKKGPADQVTPSTMVLTGQLSIRVDRLP